MNDPSYWILPPQIPPLGANDVHLWQATLDQPGWLVARFEQYLAGDEIARAAHFVFEGDRRRFIVGRGVLRAMLSGYLGIHPAQVEFRYGPYGKPGLSGLARQSGLDFNLSHSRDLVVYAITKYRAIGIDIEYIRLIPDMEPIIVSHFSPQECAAWRSVPAEKKTEAFFICWTRKEAVIKAIGDGLTYPLDRFSVSLLPHAPAALLNLFDDTQSAQAWSLQTIALGDDYAGALAVHARGMQFSHWLWNPSLVQV